jgi:hypothetical protein
MLIQLRTDNHIHNSETLAAGVRPEVENALQRFGNQLRRVEVYLQDVNNHKGGPHTRCSVEARLAGHQPVAVHDIAAGIGQAVSGAVDKLTRALDHRLGRLRDRQGHGPMSGEET